MRNKKHIIILRETLAQSVISDAVTFTVCCAIFGIGQLAYSSAMSWMGAVMFFIFLIGRGMRKGDGRMSIQEAREYLDKIEAEKAP